LHAELSSTFQNVVYDVTNGFLNVEVVFFFFSRVWLHSYFKGWGLVHIFPQNEMTEWDCLGLLIESITEIPHPQVKQKTLIAYSITML